MNIQKLHIVNYKNHENLILNFKKNIVCFVGENGIGKTNVLDAIHYTCIGKSYFTSSDKNCIAYNNFFFRIVSTLNENEIVITYESSKKKQIVLNDIKIKKLSEYLGVFPIVVIAPDDNIILLGGSEERRRYINQTLVQTNKKYFLKLNEYKKILAQRNAFLKTSFNRFLDLDLMATYNEKLIPLAKYIYKERNHFIEEIIPFFENSYEKIANKKETFRIEYKSQLKENDYKMLLTESLEKDKILKRTTAGIHKDDLVFYMNDVKIKTFGSQGQQKTFLLALKLAQYEYLQKKLSKSVFFIIDDIFDKIDTDRSKNLISFVSKHLGQVFVSYTNKNILERKFKDVDYQLIEL